MWAGLLTRPRGGDWCCVVGAHCSGHHKLYLVWAAFLSLYNNNSWLSYSTANTLVIYIGYRTHLSFPISDWPGSFSWRQITSLLSPCGDCPMAHSLRANQTSIRFCARPNRSGLLADNRKRFLHTRTQKEKVFHPLIFRQWIFFRYHLSPHYVVLRMLPCLAQSSSAVGSRSKDEWTRWFIIVGWHELCEAGWDQLWVVGDEDDRLSPVRRYVEPSQ